MLLGRTEFMEAECGLSPLDHLNSFSHHRLDKWLCLGANARDLSKWMKARERILPMIRPRVQPSITQQLNIHSLFHLINYLMNLYNVARAMTGNENLK